VVFSREAIVFVLFFKKRFLGGQTRPAKSPPQPVTQCPALNETPGLEITVLTQHLPCVLPSLQM